MEQEFRGRALRGEINPITIHHFHGGYITKLHSIEETHFEVQGQIYQTGTNTELPFSKKFDTQENAERYLRQMAKSNPVSEIVIRKITSQDLVIYL
jgi:hypothetical protein